MQPRWVGKRQRGQALIYGIFVLVGGLAALFFLFNTGQLIRDKTKLVTTSDAVAYSAGVMNARTLNYEAYANRAMMANTVAIAQLVSLSSWVQYTDNLAKFGIAAENPKFVAFYPSYYAALYSGPTLHEELNESDALKKLAMASDDLIRGILMNAQKAAAEGLFLARQELMKEVANANYDNDGSVEVDPLPFPGPLADDFPNFVKPYSGDERTRFAEVVKVAANNDPFLKKRTWFMPALYPDCVSAFPRTDWLDRRGGTELIGFDQWQARDTLSEKRWVPSNKTDITCRALSETPTGWGQVAAADSPTLDIDPTHYDHSMLVNPASTALSMATSASWGYSGLPNYYDLNADMRNKADPRLLFATRITRNKDQTPTSEARSDIKNTPRLNTYQAKTAGGNALVAVSASEVFFQREASAQDNTYGRDALSKPRELGSLFNPYWQVHLIQSDASVKRARFYQGILLPWDSP
jgi:hypothetical protein